MLEEIKTLHLSNLYTANPSSLGRHCTCVCVIYDVCFVHLYLFGVHAYMATYIHIHTTNAMRACDPRLRASLRSAIMVSHMSVYVHVIVRGETRLNTWHCLQLRHMHDESLHFLDVTSLSCWKIGVDRSTFKMAMG